MSDMKHGLTGSRPKLSILGRWAMIYMCRGMEYGAAKYLRSNYLAPPPKGVTEVDRFRGYLDAAMRHITAVTQAIAAAEGGGGDVRAAIGCVDDESSGKFPPSMLPHIAHALASLMIAVEVAVMDKLLPADPGQPWAKTGQTDLPQKDDPEAERRRAERRASHDFLDHEKQIIDKRVENGAYDVFPPRREPNL